VHCVPVVTAPCETHRRKYSAAHASSLVQEFPSSHVVPFGMSAYEHVPCSGSQASVVQSLPSYAVDRSSTQAAAGA
jgi:hypothetical protein